MVAVIEALPVRKRGEHNFLSLRMHRYEGPRFQSCAAPRDFPYWIMQRM